MPISVQSASLVSRPCASLRAFGSPRMAACQHVTVIVAQCPHCEHTFRMTVGTTISKPVPVLNPAARDEGEQHPDAAAQTAKTPLPTAGGNDARRGSGIGKGRGSGKSRGSAAGSGGGGDASPRSTEHSGASDWPSTLPAPPPPPPGPTQSSKGNMKRTLPQSVSEQPEGEQPPPWRQQGGPPPQARVEPRLEQHDTKLHGSTTPKVKGSVGVQRVTEGQRVATYPRASPGTGASSATPAAAATVIDDSDEEEDESWGKWKAKA